MHADDANPSGTTSTAPAPRRAAVEGGASRAKADASDRAKVERLRSEPRPAPTDAEVDAMFERLGRE